MATEVVVKESLSSEKITAGAELTRLLDAANFPVTASFWFYFSETNVWKLVIASPRIKDNGPKEAYERIQAVIASIPDNGLKISLRDVVVLDSTDSLVSLLRIAIVTGPGISGIRFSQNGINGVFIEDAYIYRLT
jgi:hypothetical protein